MSNPSSDPLVSIIMRSHNEGWALRQTLAGLQNQEYTNWELIVIDSGSTDDSVDLIRKANPKHFIQIKAEDYNPSRVMNHGMRLAESPYAIFLNADATPQGPRWLRPLVTPLLEPNNAAVFGRQIPRPDCRAVAASGCGSNAATRSCGPGGCKIESLAGDRLASPGARIGTSGVHVGFVGK